MRTNYIFYIKWTLFSCLLHAFKKKWFNVKIDKWNLLEYTITHYFWQYTTINQSGINWTSNLFMWLIMTKKFGYICHIQGTRPLIPNKLAANFALFFLWNQWFLFRYDHHFKKQCISVPSEGLEIGTGHRNTPGHYHNRGNHSFLKFEIVANSNSCRNISIFTW